MKEIGIILSCTGLGDILSSIPVIKYLSKIYKYKIKVFTYNIEIFKNFPYIEVHYFDEYKDYENILTMFNTFQLENNIHSKIDIRQFHANILGFQLLPDELELDFYPDEYKDIHLPKDYVVIHPSKTWPSRTWNPERWQKLVDLLNERNISVVSVGKNNIYLPIFEINNVINLVDKLDIHQTWHVLNKSQMVITMDSGILHLAGSTDTFIVQLGSSINPIYRTPYRNGSQKYKCVYILGKCNKFCASDLKYSMNYGKHDNHLWVPPISYCLERIDESVEQPNNLDTNIYQCHPDVNQVIKSIDYILK
jgi:ADP-heptose:LPS heptosyltransferase